MTQHVSVAAASAPADVPREPSRTHPTVSMTRVRHPRRRWWVRGLVTPVLCGGIFALACVVAVLAPLLAPHDPNLTNLGATLTPPMWQEGGSSTYPLGTDSIGRDILSRVVHGARTSMLVGFLGVVLSALIGVVAGLVSGFWRGWIDRLFVMVADVQLAFPFLVLAVVIVAATGTSMTNVVIVLTLSGWVLFGRVVRAEVLTLRESEYVQASKALGAGSLRLMFTAILPNVMPSIIVIGTFTFAQLVMLEASLSFLGVGLPPEIATWGSMIEDGRQYLGIAWWVTTVPAIALVTVVLAINVLGDWLRDHLDPKLRL